MRAGAAVGGAPFVQVAGRGPYAIGADGAEYVDYVMAYGPLLFGHAHPALAGGFDALARRGTVFGSTHPEEERLAERLCAAVPSVERVRFTSTGTEAVMSAVRVARAFTARPLLLRFGGNYHGHFDAALHGAGASASAGGAAHVGIPASAVSDVAVARYNSVADMDRVLAGRSASLAAILLEPIVGNMGLVLPVPGFLDGVFERARTSGALVIFDEVITWLRLGLGGAQAAVAQAPDLTTFGKVMGGGLPLAAFGGRADVMSVLAPEGAVFTGGTFSGNPLSVALGHRVLDFIESDRDLYRRLDGAGRRLAGGLRAAFADLGFDFAVTQLGSMVDFKFRRGPAVRNYDEAREADGQAFAAYYHAMRERGILLAPSANELMFLSTEHADADIDRTVAAAHDSLRALRREGIV